MALTPKLIELRTILHDRTDPEKSKIKAAAYVVNNLMQPDPRLKGIKINQLNADGYLFQVLKALLNKNRYLDAAALLWSEEMFTSKPEYTQRIWGSLENNTVTFLMGSGSVSKSYSMAAYFLLDWVKVPLWTCVKCISVTSEHAERNVFAHIKTLHEYSAIKLPGNRAATSIQASDNAKQGIHLVAVPKDDSGDAILRGFHPSPIPGQPHPEFGFLSRVRALLDEAEGIPTGVWTGIHNMLITVSEHPDKHVKVGAATNPMDVASDFAELCEPVGGWSSVDLDHTIEWKPARNPNHSVLRLDGARCENVVQRKLVYPGLLSYEGYLAYEREGTQSPSYLTMARGMYPMTGSDYIAIPQSLIEASRGIFHFTAAPRWCLSLDPALDGGDRPVATIGKWGQVDGFMNSTTKEFKYFDEIRWGLQAEQQFILQGRKSKEMAQEIVSVAKDLHISPEMIIIDSTGIGEGVYSMACMMYGESIVGVNWSEKATETPILADQTKRACDLYLGINTEMHFSVRRMMEFDAMKLGPLLAASTELTQELSKRKYKQNPMGMVRIESKQEYKTRGKRLGGIGRSPDCSDSLSMLTFLVRTVGSFEASMMPERPREVTDPDPKPSFHGLPVVNLTDNW